MAVNRTVLPYRGAVQPQHGAAYETDEDANWTLLDNAIDKLLLTDFNFSGVVSGFALGTSATLTPTLTVGVLYANGGRWAPGSVAPGAAPANATNYLFYNFSTGFYYQASAAAATTGDALIGQVVTSGTAVTAVTQATKLYGQLAAAPGAPGNFTLQHFLGRAPTGALIQMTSGGAIWFQSASMYDATNLYLVATDSGITAKVLLW